MRYHTDNILIKGDNMLLMINLTPAQMARHLSESFGYAVSASVIVKWDNMILKKPHTGGGDEKGARRMYSMADATLFNGIAVMRSLGYSIESIKNVFDLNLNDAAAEKECTTFIEAIKEKATRQKKGLDLYAAFFPALKGRYGRPGKHLFKPAGDAALACREQDRLHGVQDASGVKPRKHKSKV